MGNISTSRRFTEQRNTLPPHIRKKIEKVFLLFQDNPFHPSLRLHQLSGKLKEFWSVSIDLKYRIMFKFTGEGNALFVSVGTHAIYDR